jgi:selenocysteine-specific elongation factor
MKGFGAVAAGTLIAGRVRRDDEVEVLPARRPARVRGIQVHGRAVDEAVAGQRTALNLQRVDLGDIERGMVVTVPGLFSPSTTFDVHLELLESADPMPSRKRIRFHVGTAELIGHVVLLGQDTLEPGASAFARVRVERPAFAMAGDRFIIRQYSPMTTLAGGEILDAQPPRSRRSDPSLVDRLRVFKDGSTADKVLRLAIEAGAATLQQTDLVARLGLASEEALEVVRQLAAEGRVRILSEQPLVVAVEEALQDAAEQAAGAVIAFHTTEPLMPGIGREDLKARVFANASPLFFRGVLDRLVTERRITVDQDVVRAFGHAVTLQGADERAREQLSARFRELGLQVPTPDDLAASVGVDRATGRKIIQLLLNQQAVVKINETMIVDRAALQQLIEKVRARRSVNPRLGVGEFKDLTGLSRKFAVPLLEYLDGQRITRRVGDERVIL